jgi:hypothetical protein
VYTVVIAGYILAGCPILPDHFSHKARGKPPNNRIHHAKRDYARSLVKENYPDFGPTLAAENLAEHHGFTVSRETLRKWMIEDGIWLSHKHRRTFHQPRWRRECYGELIQIDGSDYRWFEDRAPPCTLLVFIDDATSTLMELRFVKSESTFIYFEALVDSYLLQYGRPVAFYSDKHTVFRVSKTDAKTLRQTMNVQPIKIAHSIPLFGELESGRRDSSKNFNKS